MFSFTFNWRPSQTWKDFGITWLGFMSVASVALPTFIVSINFLSLFVEVRPEAIAFLNSPRGWFVFILAVSGLMAFFGGIDLLFDEGEQRRNHTELHRRNITRFNFVNFYFWIVPSWIIRKIRRMAP